MINRPPRATRHPAAWLIVVVLGLSLATSFGAPVATLAQNATPAASPVATKTASPALTNAVAYLLSQQDASGAFPGFDGSPDPGTTTDAILALRAAATQGLATDDAIAAAVGFLDAEPGFAYAATGPGQAAKVVLALVAAGEDPTAFGGQDLLASLNASFSAAAPATPGAPAIVAGSVYQHALVILALTAAGAPVPAEAIAALQLTEVDGGGWAFGGETTAGTADSNTTALVIQALVASGYGDDPMVASGLEYLKSALTDLGQFRYAAGGADPGDANSTALGVQALIAAGQDPASSDWRNVSRGLSVFQNVDGSFRYMDSVPGANLLATVQAVPALAGLPLPVVTQCPAVLPLRVVPCLPLAA